MNTFNRIAAPTIARNETIKDLLIIGAAVLMGTWLWRRLRNFVEGGCTQCSACNSTPMFSKGHFHQVTHPIFNVREMCKELVLLEQHLFDARQRCPQCIRKHFIHSEALAEEAVTLDAKGAYPFIKAVPDKIRSLIKSYAMGIDPTQVAQGVRVIRKDLLAKCFYIKDPSEDTSLDEKE